MGKRVITPDFAERVLKEDNDTNFRPYNDSMAEKFGRDMLNNNWRYISGQTIKFTREGKLIDGQHRLGGVAISGISQDFFVENHYSDEDKYWIDQGKPRTLGNILQSMGYSDANNIAATKRLEVDVINYKRGRSGQTGAKASFREIIDMVTADEDIQFAVNFARENVPAKLLRRSTTAYMYAIFHRIDPDDAALFFNGLVHLGTDVPENSPIRALHQRLAFGNWTAVGRILRLQEVATITFAWNAYRNDEPRHNLKLGQTTKGKFSIPEPV